MFANPKWFKRRKYGGWGVTPDTKEGWIFLAVIMAALPLSLMLTGNEQQKMWVTAVWLIYLMLEVFNIMLHMPKDERERVQEAIAERNAAWAMLTVIIGGLMYQIITTAITEINQIDPIIIAILLAGAAAKSITNWKLRKK